MCKPETPPAAPAGSNPSGSFSATIGGQSWSAAAPSPSDSPLRRIVPSAAECPLHVVEIVMQHVFDLARDRPAERREKSRRKARGIEIEFHRHLRPVA